MLNIHVIDDDVYIRELLLEHLSAQNYDVRGFATAEAALNVLKKDPPNLVLLDLKLPGMHGMNYLKLAKEQIPDLEVIIITAYADVESAVTAIKLGAREYVKKPFDLNEITTAVKKAVKNNLIDAQLDYLSKLKNSEFKEFIGTSKPMQEVFKFIRQVANSPRTSILIHGETGTGKELVARAIHSRSTRAKKPFIEVNCSAFQDTLLESELFGYEAGAFTGAQQRKKGLLELANEGTFFFDEIGEMSSKLQVKLLKVIEEQSLYRVGGLKENKINIRIVSASSQNLEDLVKARKFQQALYYRLNVARIELPPLKKRGKDIILLADHFIKKFNLEFSKKIKGLKEDARKMLLKHTWPGNVRELRNVIERGILFEKGDYLSVGSIALMNLANPDLVLNFDESFFEKQYTMPDEGISLQGVEDILIRKALSKVNGNQSKAAKLLNISREKLRYRIGKMQQPES